MRRAIITATVVGLALTVAACSSSGNSGQSNSAAPTSGSTAPSTSVAATGGPTGGSTGGSSASGTPIKIGLICDCTGTFGASAIVNNKVVQAWAKSVNAAGGLSGHPVDLDIKDDSSNPANSVTAVQQLISDHVAAIIDDTVLDSAWSDAVSKAKIPVIAGDLNNAPFYTNPDFYPSGQTFDHALAAIILTAKGTGASNLGLLYCAESPTCQQAVGAVKSLGDQYGVPLKYSGSISATAPNYTAQCLAAKQAGIAALFVADTASVDIHLINDCAQQNYHPKYLVAGAAYSQQLADTVGPDDTLLTEFPELPTFATDKAPVQKMVAALDKYYPGLRNDKVNYSGAAPAYWTAGLLVGAAVKAAHVSATASVGAEQILNGLNSLKGETLGGFSPPLTFTAGKPHSVDCWYTASTTNGKSSLIKNGKLTCTK